MNEGERLHMYNAKRKRQKKKGVKKGKRSRQGRPESLIAKGEYSAIIARLSAAKIRSNIHFVLLITRKYRDTVKEINGRLAKELFSAANVLLTN